MLLKKSIISGLVASSIALSSIGCGVAELTASGQIKVTPQGQEVIKQLAESFGLILTTEDASGKQNVPVKPEDIETVLVNDKEVSKDQIEIKEGQIVFKNLAEGDYLIKIKYKNVNDYIKFPLKRQKGQNKAKLIAKIDKERNIELAEGGIIDERNNFIDNYVIVPSQDEQDYNIFRRDNNGDIESIQINANFKINIGPKLNYQDPGLGIINRRQIPLVIFVLPEEIKKDNGKIVKVWLEEDVVPPFGVKITDKGNLGIASSILKQFRDKYNKSPKFIKIAVNKPNFRAVYTIELKKELPKLKNDGIDIVINDFVIYVNKNVNPQDIKPIPPKRLGWVFIPEVRVKDIVKVNKVWVDGILVPIDNIKLGSNVKTKEQGIFIDIKPFTMNPLYKVHKVVIAVKTSEPKRNLKRLVYKLQVKFPKAILPIVLKGPLPPKQTIDMKPQPSIDQEVVTTVVDESAVKQEQVTLVEENTISTETATEAIIISTGETNSNSLDEIPSNDELVTSTETVTSQETIIANDNEIIEMSDVEEIKPIS